MNSYLNVFPFKDDFLDNEHQKKTLGNQNDKATILPEKNVLDPTDIRTILYANVVNKILQGFKNCINSYFKMIMISVYLND